MKQLEINSNYFFIILFILILFMTYKIIAPFLSAIIGAILISFILYPLNKKIRKKIKKPNLAATIMLLIVILIILIPLSLVATSLLKELNSSYDLITSTDISYVSTQIEEFIGINLNIEGMIHKGLSTISTTFLDSISGFFFTFIQGFINFFIMMFLLFYLFRDGEKILKKLKDALPIKKKNRDLISKELTLVTYAVIYGFIISGIAQGLVGGIGFFIFGIENAVLWGIIMAILSIIPLIGPWLIWFPASIYLIVSGQIVPGILLMIYGFIIISNIDNLIKPLVIGAKSKIHPAIVLLGVFGGLKVMGLIGIIVGPLILGFLSIFIKIMREKYVFKS
ncbi:MAG: AI-2E family transporter [Nanoarchaeota archaeon]|nr:AI-2E family transporter [Nanoarchaeota archaeon]